MGILTSTALLNRIIRQVTSEALQQEMVYFLLGEEKEAETAATIAQNPLRHRLIEHCDHLSDEVLIKKLSLFRICMAPLMNLPSHLSQFFSHYRVHYGQIFNVDYLHKLIS